MRTFKPTLAAAALALAGIFAAFTATPAAAAPAWITVGDDAMSIVRRAAPDAQVLSTREVALRVPERRGSARLVDAAERVHVVQLDERALLWISAAVHGELRRCGGYVRHDSMAEALAVLHRLRGDSSPEAAPSYGLDDAVVLQPLLPQLQASHILSTIEGLASFQNRMYNSSAGVAASDWLAAQWRTLAAGRSDVAVSQVTHRGWPQKSVKLVVRGRGSNAAETVVIGGHLDSISQGPVETMRAPGADDDASGIATMTEVIRVLLASGWRPQRTLEFIAYAAEEVGLRGSQQIATQYQRTRKPVVGVLQLDMTAFQGNATDLYIFTDYTNVAQNQFVAALAASYLPTLTVGYDRCGYGCSDHASWTGRGFAASFPFESSFADSNPRIHTPEDTTAVFGNQANHALKFAQLALAFAVELGGD